ncbi:hypothetical protein Aperf_G00000082386 [Anoplocephala perfoliata]
MDYNITTPSPFAVNASQSAAHIPAMYFTVPYRLLGTIAASLSLVVGLSGNFLVITVIMWSSKMRSPTNCYLVSLSFSDMLFLLNAAAPFIWELYVMIGQWNFGSLACRTIIAIQYFSVDTSILSMAAFSVERWVAICHPMRAQTLCTVNRAVKIIAGIWIFCAAYNSVWLFTVDTLTVQYAHGNYTTCTYKFSRASYSTVYLLDLILFYTLPLGVIFAMYMQIASRLFKFNKPIWLNSNKEPVNTGEIIVNRLHSSVQVGGNALMTEQNRQTDMCRTACRRVRSRKKVIKMLMAVVFLFAVFWLPYRTAVVYNSFGRRKRIDYWLYLFAKTMAYLNSTVNPILYNAMSKKFRRAFRLLITQASCFGKQRTLNRVLGSRRTECMRSRDYLRQIQQRRQELSGNINSESQPNELQPSESGERIETLKNENT